MYKQNLKCNLVKYAQEVDFLGGGDAVLQLPVKRLHFEKKFLLMRHFVKSGIKSNIKSVMHIC